MVNFSGGLTLRWDGGLTGGLFPYYFWFKNCQCAYTIKFIRNQEMMCSG